MKQAFATLGFLCKFGIFPIYLVQSPSIAMGQEAIVIEEFGVARAYEASKSIVCDSVEWRVTWRSQSQEPHISGEIVALVSGDGHFLGDGQEEVFGRFSSIDGVSATCNPGRDQIPTRSHLLISG